MKEFNSINPVFEILKNVSNNIIKKYSTYDDNPYENLTNKYVWFFWWQGIETAPKIIKLCYSSVQRNFKDWDITVISKNNIFKYVNIPFYIYNHTFSKRLTLTSFSDILRMSLLAQKGGLWLDSTVLIVKTIENMKLPYYTIRKNNKFQYVNGRWSGYAVYSVKNNIVPRFCSEVLYEYMKYYDHFVDYFLIDCVMILGYQYIPAFKRAIENVPYNNPQVLNMLPLLNKKYSKEKLDSLLVDTSIFKLTWKQKFREKKSNYKTLFGVLVDEYLS